MKDPIKIILRVTDYDIPIDRLDVWVTRAINSIVNSKKNSLLDNLSFSRNKIKKLIATNNIQINGIIVKNPSLKININQTIEIKIPSIDEGKIIPQNIKLEILYEDKYLIILNKKAGMVVHPAPGNPDNTLVNALLHHCGKQLQGIGGIKRPGIVHRLDKNTSGIMVVAKNEISHHKLCEIFSNHDLERTYNAIVWGMPPVEGFIKKPIGRSIFNRKKMSINNRGKLAITKWKVIESYFPISSLVECKLETGRTHQIRVHLSDLGHSVVGDPVYGRLPSTKNINSHDLREKIKLTKQFDRQALHAISLSFKHPITNKILYFESKLPNDMLELIRILKM